MVTYAEFLESKTQDAGNFGFDPVWMPDFLFDFQKALVEWAQIKGRAALFEDCGLGKTPQQLVWAENVTRKTRKKVLILTPLAVSAQTVCEGEKFGIECTQSRNGDTHRLTVTNYERLHYFNPKDFAGAVCDESSAIKAFEGKRRKEVTRFLSKMKYRLLCTATAAPNDYVELGTSSEALGYLGQIEMLGQFFKNDAKTVHQLFKNGDFWTRHKWFFKAHSETPFWRWVCSWARAIRRPEDLGFNGDAFRLPELVVNQHVVKCDRPFNGELFIQPARTLKEQREERKITMKARCERVAELVAHDKPAVAWCQYNEEGDMLEKMIPGAVQVAGCDTDEDKEARLIGFQRGDFRVLITKPKIGAWGLNWQHCGHHTFFPSHSFEQYYQSVRRSLRFGRIGPVQVDIVTTEGEEGVTANLYKKQHQAEEMFAALAREMNNALNMKTPQDHLVKGSTPSWM